MKSETGASLIEVSIILMLSLLFVSGTTYTIYLTKQAASAREVLEDFINIKTMLDDDTNEYLVGETIGAEKFGMNYVNYKISFSSENNVAIYWQGQKRFSLDEIYMICVLARKDCAYFNDNKIKYISPLRKTQNINDAGFNIHVSPSMLLPTLIFKRD
ncbi:hypothetical protein GY514_004965 [Escherichia coli]|nr:hypothetical protein [Escherichia coli]